MTTIQPRTKSIAGASTRRKLETVAISIALALISVPAAAQAPEASGKPPAVIPVESEPRAALHIYPPVPEALARGVVILQFRTEHFRVLPVFGKGALGVSPRVGHLHVTVNGLPLTWAHTSGDPIIVVGLKPGAHEILLELADPAHGIVAAQTAKITLPDPKVATLLASPSPSSSHSVHRH